ncbi:hypothetical protein ACTQ49_10405 [Luteococcus sp. Sow4_B9]|uniref:hypothetical protein n=1 Tax=Luteococcus sp. Sow4_B9 TaxID=3438792 RepID=UPI003F97D376
MDWSRRAGHLLLAEWLVNLRNIFQVLVSADPRYGPIFSAGVAQTMTERLVASGYREGTGEPVVLLGWSGGAQIALGAAWFLAGQGIPVHVVTLGGVFTADPGLDRVQHFTTVHGSRDMVYRLGPIAFPGRRRWARRSPWRRAIAQGRVSDQRIGPLKHVGRGSYLSGYRIDGVPGFEHTARQLSLAIERSLEIGRGSGPAPGR